MSHLSIGVTTRSTTALLNVERTTTTSSANRVGLIVSLTEWRSTFSLYTRLQLLSPKHITFNSLSFHSTQFINSSLHNTHHSRIRNTAILWDDQTMRVQSSFLFNNHIITTQTHSLPYYTSRFYITSVTHHNNHTPQPSSFTPFTPIVSTHLHASITINHTHIHPLIRSNSHLQSLQSHWSNRIHRFNTINKPLSLTIASQNRRVHSFSFPTLFLNTL